MSGFQGPCLLQWVETKVGRAGWSEPGEVHFGLIQGSRDIAAVLYG
jgi:hypothetical protein